MLSHKKTATDQVFVLIKSLFDEEVSRMKQDTELCQSRLSALFDFVEKAFSQGNEMLILVTELTFLFHVNLPVLILLISWFLFLLRYCFFPLLRFAASSYQFIILQV